MVVALTENILAPPEREAERTVKSMYWECEEWRLDGWRPFTALLGWDLFIGPNVRHVKGIDLRKNLVAYWCGPRGGEKTLSMSFHLAKEMRIGKPTWTNYPISFYVLEGNVLTGDESDEYEHVSECQWINKDRTLSYYESMPLDMDAFYTFDRKIRDGSVGIDELQYFVESRTSGKFQNRVMSYQLMQIRKTANSFFYTVQNPRWVDNRFGWSADFECKCSDIALQSYDRRHLGRELMEGELGRWEIKDLSGVITGTQFADNGKILGPYQFEGFKFWGIYPTHFIVDPEAAANSADNVNPNSKKKKAKEDLDAQFQSAVMEIVSEDMELGRTKVAVKELWHRIEEKGVNMAHNKAGEILRSMGIVATNTQHQFYSYGLIKENQRES